MEIFMSLLAIIYAIAAIFLLVKFPAEARQPVVAITLVSIGVFLLGGMFLSSCPLFY